MEDSEIDNNADKLSETILDGCILLIGPGAFINSKNGLTLREEFVLAVQVRLKDSPINVSPKTDNVSSATLALYKSLSAIDGEKWIKDFWEEINPIEYPALSYYSQLKFKAYFYFGYDSLLYSQLSSFSKKTRHVICSYSPGQGVLKMKSDDETIDIVDIMKDGKVPVVNWFGKISDHDTTAKSLVGRVDWLVSNLGKNQLSDASKINNLFSQSDTSHIILTGADMSFWYHKMLSLLCTPSYEQGPKYFFEQKQFEDQRDSNVFLDSIGMANGTSTPVEYSEKIFGKTIERLINSVNKRKVLRKFTFDIFISYTTEDIDLANKVALACIQLGYIPYISHNDNRYASHWSVPAKEVLNQVGYFLIIGTVNYLNEADKAGIAWECRDASPMENIKKIGLDFKGDITAIPGITSPMMLAPLKGNLLSIKRLLKDKLI